MNANTTIPGKFGEAQLTVLHEWLEKVKKILPNCVLASRLRVRCFDLTVNSRVESENAAAKQSMLLNSHTPLGTAVQCEHERQGQRTVEHEKGEHRYCTYVLHILLTCIVHTCTYS